MIRQIIAEKNHKHHRVGNSCEMFRSAYGRRRSIVIPSETHQILCFLWRWNHHDNDDERTFLLSFLQTPTQAMVAISLICKFTQVFPLNFFFCVFTFRSYLFSFSSSLSPSRPGLKRNHFQFVYSTFSHLSALRSAARV